jgi:hypothetical protein
MKPEEVPPDDGDQVAGHRSDDHSSNTSSTSSADSNGRDSDAIARLRRAVEVAARDGGSLAEVDEAARVLVTHLRRNKQPPEQVLLLIKQLLSDAGLRPTYAATHDPAAPVGSGASIYRDVIAWSIRHYYADPTDG